MLLLVTSALFVIANLYLSMSVYCFTIHFYFQCIIFSALSCCYMGFKCWLSMAIELFFFLLAVCTFMYNIGIIYDYSTCQTNSHTYIHTYIHVHTLYIHWASKETYSFLEWCPLKSTASKWMIFGLVLATVLLITHVKKQRNRKCQKWDKCLQITTSPISKITETSPFPAHRLRTFQ